MPYTVHTLDGQAHTYHDPVRPEVSHDGQVLTMREYAVGWPVSVYAPGQWTHYHIEPTSYRTDYNTADEERHEDKGQPTAPAKGKDKWQAEFQRHLNTGRKAAEAQ